MAKQIEPNLQTIGVYLKKEEIFRIPEYQRAYSWDITNCDKLWQDINSYISQGVEDQDPYFFGTIIIDCSQEKYLNLIDGQQRTTTFLLLIKALHLRITEVLKNMLDSETSKWIKRSLEQSLVSIFEILYRADAKKQVEIEENWDNAKNILILKNESINELYKEELKKIIEAHTYEEAENSTYKIPRKQKDNKYTNFFRNFKFFYEKLKEELPGQVELDAFAKGFLNKCQIIEIKSWQIEQAITMFNSLNSTGMPLSDADIISAQLFSKTSNKDDFKNRWRSIIENTDKLSKKRIVDIDGVLQQFMYIDRAKRGEGDVATPGVRKYYTEIRKPSLLDKPFDLCDNFDRILNIWDKIQDYPITKLLLKFNENFKFFLISYLFRVSDNKMSEGDLTPIMECFLRLFALLEVGEFSYSSRYFKIFLFKENYKLVNPDYPIDDIVNDFNKQIEDNWKKDEVIASLKEYNKNILVYLNEYIYAKEKNLSFNFDPIKVNVEHIMPTSGKNIDSIRQDAGMEKDEFEAMVNLLGNKILLEEDINKHLSNDWFKTKKATNISNKTGYKDSKFGIASTLSNYSSDKWGKDDIEKANQKAAERICRFIFNEI